MRYDQNAMALNPEILKWARQTAGLATDEAAHALGFKDTRTRTAPERLEAIETGKEEPSRSVLANMARTYHRSLLVFYLSEPPRIGDRGQDFRKAAGKTPLEYDPTLDALIRDIRGRQRIVRDLREQTESTAVDYVGSANTDISPARLAGQVAGRLGFSLAEYRNKQNVQSAFAYLREKIEESGAFVLLLGNLGSYHSNIPSSVFRGYAIADPIAPFIVINDQDAVVAWSFTALHELTHLWLGATGVSSGSTEAAIEAYCNAVAGEILLPEAGMNDLRSIQRISLPETIEAISRFAREWKVSRPMIAYKLFREGVISRTRWQELDRHYETEWIAVQAQAASADRGEGGPSYYVVKRHRLGRALLDLVKNSLAEGFITPSKAGQVLGVKPRNVAPLIYATGMRGGQ